MSVISAPITFEQFMREALYGADGFYARRGRAGRGGDFLTSPEVGPLFGAVVARFLDAEWERLGRPDPFSVIDAGAGPGTLARAILAAASACRSALRLVAVESSDTQRAAHPAGVESVATLPEGPLDGVIIANELLDNIPFRLAVYDDGWREALVVEEREGVFRELLGEVVGAGLPSSLPTPAQLGARAPLHEAAHAWVDDARSRLRSGTLVVVDYMVATTAELARRPWRDWLRTYRGHARGGHYLEHPGSQDITTEVAVDQLPEPDTVRSQAQWLTLHGIDDLVQEGKHYWNEHAARPDLAAITMRSRISEAEALLDPAGLGGFTVLEYRAPVPEGRAS